MTAHAVAQGKMKVASSAGDVKEALSKAFRLAPQRFPARRALVEFYLLAPGLLGGSNSRAAELVRTAPNPVQVRALEGRAALDEERFDQAATAPTEVPAGTDPAVAADMRQWAAMVGFRWLAKEQVAKAQGLFARLVKDQPEAALPLYGLARVLAQQDRPAEAAKLLEQARHLRGAEPLALG